MFFDGGLIDGIDIEDIEYARCETSDGNRKEHQARDAVVEMMAYGEDDRIGFEKEIDHTVNELLVDWVIRIHRSRVMTRKLTLIYNVMAISMGSVNSNTNGRPRMALTRCVNVICCFSRGAHHRSSPVSLRSLSALRARIRGLSRVLITRWTSNIALLACMFLAERRRRRQSKLLQVSFGTRIPISSSLLPHPSSR